ncbi:hypothetical protein [Microbacterium sp.]|uniref:hypothetical protein n=1 Tax=Microbacterium sp. TaxID=51671 RepID=UPI00263579BF|nr:hypothetical protein [Microbacterium sp.]
MNEKRAVMTKSNAQRIAEGIAWGVFIVGLCIVIWSLGQLIEKLFLTIGGWLF